MYPYRFMSAYSFEKQLAMNEDSRKSVVNHDLQKNPDHHKGDDNIIRGL